MVRRISREFVFSASSTSARSVPAQADRPRPAAGELQQPLDPDGVGIGAVWDRPRDFSARLSFAWPTSGEAVNDP
jgi:hypothetical protein